VQLHIHLVATPRPGQPREEADPVRDEERARSLREEGRREAEAEMRREERAEQEAMMWEEYGA
jgi:hypothetical protein